MPRSSRSPSTLSRVFNLIEVAFLTGEKGWTESLSFLCPEGYGKADVSEGRVEYVKRLSVGGYGCAVPQCYSGNLAGWL